MSGILTFVIDPTTNDNALLQGTYTLVEATGGVEADADLLKVSGLDGQPYRVNVKENSIELVIEGSRQAAEDVVWSGAETGTWDYVTHNFLLNEEDTPFVQGDKVVFNDAAAVKTVTLNEKMIQAGVLVDTDEKYIFKGDGALAGEGDLVKAGSGTLTMNITENEYTGKTIINGGILSVASLLDAGQACPIGAATADAANVQINGGTLMGAGSTSAVTVQTGGVVSPGASDTQVGTFKITGNFTLQKDAKLIVKVRKSTNSKFNVSGSSFTMAGNDTILIQPISGTTFEVGDKLTLFTGAKPASGWTVLSTDGSQWDDSTLAEDGCITCAAVDGIASVRIDANATVDVYDLSGRKIRSQVRGAEALDGLLAGVYIVNGNRYYKK